MLSLISSVHLQLSYNQISIVLLQLSLRRICIRVPIYPQKKVITILLAVEFSIAVNFSWWVWSGLIINGCGLPLIFVLESCRLCGCHGLPEYWWHWTQECWHHFTGDGCHGLPEYWWHWTQECWHHFTGDGYHGWLPEYFAGVLSKSDLSSSYPGA